MSRSRHPNKHIEAALQHAESKGWRIEQGGTHAWGRMFCPANRRGGCAESVYSTPRNPENHAKHLRRSVDACRCELSE